MARVRLIVVVCLALAAVAATSKLAYARQVDAKAAAAAVKASPDLVKSLSTELGSTPEQAAGAAGSLILIVGWVYYASLILFLGAEATQVYARDFGSGIVPDAHARKIESN